MREGRTRVSGLLIRGTRSGEHRIGGSPHERSDMREGRTRISRSLIRATSSGEHHIEVARMSAATCGRAEPGYRVRSSGLRARGSIAIEVARMSAATCGRAEPGYRVRSSGLRAATATCGGRFSALDEEAVQDAPGQLVIHTDANDVVVQAHALIARKSGARSRIEIRFILQPDIEVFDLCRPVAREPHLDAAAHRPAPMPVLL